MNALVDESQRNDYQDEQWDGGRDDNDDTENLESGSPEAAKDSVPSSEGQHPRSLKSSSCDAPAQNFIRNVNITGEAIEDCADGSALEELHRSTNDSGKHAIMQLTSCANYTYAIEHDAVDVI